MEQTTGARCPACGGRNGSLPGFRQLAEIAARIPIDSFRTAGETVYTRRLEICGACGALRESVLCSYCGCFVQFRARGIQSFCPHPKGDFWKKDFKELHHESKVDPA